MNLVKLKIAVILAAFTFSIVFQSCKKDVDPVAEEEPDTESVFAIGGILTNPFSSYLLQTSSLTSGEVSFLGSGANVTTQAPSFFDFVVKDGFYYSYLSNENTFAKYTYENQTLKLVSIIPFVLANGNRHGHYWVDDKTLLFYGARGAYKIINTETMTVTKEGALDLPLKTGLNIPNTGFMAVKEGKLYVGLSYGDPSYPASVSKPGLTNYDSGTSYFVVYDYPSITNPIYSEDSRTCSIGNDRNGVLKTFIYNDDLYITSSPLPTVGQNYDKPTGILRFKKGATSVDPTYFFDLSGKLNGDFLLGGAYAGNGKLLIRRYRSDLATWANPTGVWNQEYNLVDLAANTVKPLDIPLSNTTATTPNIFADNGVVYMAVNTTDAGAQYYIYSYDTATGKVTKGVKVSNIDDVRGLFKIK